ncbi:MAG: helix-turn-helix transcriptional regulator [Desulfobacterales bacterium]|nr:helix-turn-helix transcriptional regulator [Desulfobacterales bacterium]MCP4164176.1 helix-turn-helix transcriptional regulator [Deltaproteobacteria bacterium]
MSKYEMDTDEIEKFSRMFKALSNPGRLRILLELASCIPKEGFSGTQQEQENSQQNFAQCLGLAQSTVSHHFKELRQAGLLYMRRDGQKTIISVNFEALESIQKLLK